MQIKKSSIEILDCTLRDGGYINNWDFKQNSIKNIIKSLADAGIESIECGFLTEKTKCSTNSTLFSNPEALSYLLPEKSHANYTLMLNYGEVPQENIPKNEKTPIEIRIAFKKHSLNEIKLFCNQLKDKGYTISLNPMHTSIYTRNELDLLIRIADELRPSCLTVVDTMGIMTETDTTNLFTYLDTNVNKNISLGFHSHNNLKLSMLNTKQLLNLKLSRKIIIDSCIAGMGRGAGILKTEDITGYLNEYFGSNYNLTLISAAANKYIYPIKNKYKWEYSNTYYLSALNRCHPNYAAYLNENTNLSKEEINLIFKNIPTDYRTIYNENIIKSLVKLNHNKT